MGKKKLAKKREKVLEELGQLDESTEKGAKKKEKLTAKLEELDSRMEEAQEVQE